MFSDDAPKTPLALQWAVFIREHGTDLKLSKEARVLGLALITYGEGKRIFASMVTLAEKTGMKRETVRKARRELQDKGLLEDITGDPSKQERTYRLTTPGYVVPEEGRVATVYEDKVVPERATPGPQEDHNINLLDQSRDQQLHQASQARGDVVDVSPKRDEGVVDGFSRPEADPGNTFILWQAKSGPRKGTWVEYTLARPPRHRPKDARQVTLTPGEAQFMRESWPMVRALAPAARAERAAQRAKYLLMDTAERNVLVNGTAAGGAAEQQGGLPAYDRVLNYLVHDHLDLTSGLPEDLADLGMNPVVNACEELANDYGLAGDRYFQRYFFDRNALCTLAEEDPAWFFSQQLAQRGDKGMWAFGLDEIAAEYRIPESRLRAVLDELVKDGHATLSGHYYRDSDAGD
jgi:hypothetical protein